jgi:hypothetical protein
MECFYHNCRAKEEIDLLKKQTDNMSMITGISLNEKGRKLVPEDIVRIMAIYSSRGKTSAIREMRNVTCLELKEAYEIISGWEKIWEYNRGI